MFKKETILELANVLREDYGHNLALPEVEDVAHALVGLFETVLQANVECNYHDYEKPRLDKST